MPSPQAQRTVFQMYGIYFFENLSLDLAIWSFYFTQVGGLSIGAATSVHVLIFLTIGLTDLPTGSWADRFGRKRFALLGFLLRLVGIAITLLFPNIYGLCIASIVTGLGWSFLSGSLEALLFDNLKALKSEGDYQAILANCMSFAFGARVVGFIISSFLYTANPILPYCAMAFALCLGSLLVFLYREENYDRPTTGSNWAQINETLKALRSASIAATILIPLLLADCLANGVWVTFQPLFAGIESGIEWIGPIYAVGAFGSLIGSQLSKKLKPNENFQNTLRLYLGSFLLGSLVLATNQSVPFLIVGVFVISIAWGISYPVRSTVINSVVPSAQRATALSCYSTVTMILKSFISSIVGFLTGAFTARVTIIVITSLLIFLLTYMWRRGGVSTPRESNGG